MKGQDADPTADRGARVWDGSGEASSGFEGWIASLIDRVLASWGLRAVVSPAG